MDKITFLSSRNIKAFYKACNAQTYPHKNYEAQNLFAHIMYANQFRFRHFALKTDLSF